MAAGYRSSAALPALAPYLRAKYDLPPAAVHQLQADFDRITRAFDSTRRQEDSHDQRSA
jgi:hypothetical protein